MKNYIKIEFLKYGNIANDSLYINGLINTYIMNSTLSYISYRRTDRKMEPQQVNFKARVGAEQG